MTTPETPETPGPDSTAPGPAGSGQRRAGPMGCPGTASDGGDVAPGSPEALARGCCCSVLANAAYRIGAAITPVIDPDCAVDHREPHHGQARW